MTPHPATLTDLPAPLDPRPTTRAPEAMWRVTARERVVSYGPYEATWSPVDGAPPALSPARAAELWAEAQSYTGRVRVTSDDGASTTARVGAQLCYRATTEEAL